MFNYIVLCLHGRLPCTGICFHTCSFQNRSPSLDIDVRLLLSIDRRTSLEDAWDTLALAESSREKHGQLIVGLDLSGDPNVSMTNSSNYTVDVKLIHQVIPVSLIIHVSLSCVSEYPLHVPSYLSIIISKTF